MRNNQIQPCCENRWHGFDRVDSWCQKTKNNQKCTEKHTRGIKAVNKLSPPATGAKGRSGPVIRRWTVFFFLSLFLSNLLFSFNRTGRYENATSCTKLLPLGWVDREASEGMEKVNRKWVKSVTASLDNVEMKQIIESSLLFTSSVTTCVDI